MNDAFKIAAIGVIAISAGGFLYWENRRIERAQKIELARQAKATKEQQALRCAYKRLLTEHALLLTTMGNAADETIPTEPFTQFKANQVGANVQKCRELVARLEVTDLLNKHTR